MAELQVLHHNDRGGLHRLKRRQSRSGWEPGPQCAPSRTRRSCLPATSRSRKCGTIGRIQLFHRRGIGGVHLVDVLTGLFAVSSSGRPGRLAGGLADHRHSVPDKQPVDASDVLFRAELRRARARCGSGAALAFYLQVVLTFTAPNAENQRPGRRRRRRRRRSSEKANSSASSGCSSRPSLGVLVLRASQERRTSIIGAAALVTSCIMMILRAASPSCCVPRSKPKRRRLRVAAKPVDGRVNGYANRSSSCGRLATG